MGFFDFLGTPLGYVLGWIFNLVNNYFLAIFIFTFAVRLLMFPLSLKTQKSQADRARLAPRLERLQKKYAKDPKKLQEKQMALYEKHGISMTGGCLPMVVQMIVLFGIISAIYSPLTHLTNIPDEVIDTTATVLQESGDFDKNYFGASYYRELRILQHVDNEKYEAKIASAITAIDGKNYTDAQAKQYVEQMREMDFSLLGINLLEQPNQMGFGLLWLIPLFSGITAMLSSLLSMHYQKQVTKGQVQQGQGCSNVMMLGLMPAMSLFIAFSVPGAVGLYWICSNLIALLQTFVLNQIYNPAKIRAQAEIEYEERRRKKQEDKKRLAEARAREQRELAQQMKQEGKGGQKKKAATPAPKADKPAEEPAAESVTEAPAEEPEEAETPAVAEDAAAVEEKTEE